MQSFKVMIFASMICISCGSANFLGFGSESSAKGGSNINSGSQPPSSANRTPIVGSTSIGDATSGACAITGKLPQGISIDFDFVNGGPLVVIGDDSDNNILLSGRNISKEVLVSGGAEAGGATIPCVDSIVIRGNGGHDFIRLMTTFKDISLILKVYGGSGCDTLSGTGGMRDVFFDGGPDNRASDEANCRSL